MRDGREPFHLALLASSGTWIALSAFALFLLMLAMLLGPFQACENPPRRDARTRVGVWLPASAESDS